MKLVRDEERRDRTGQPRSRGFGFVEFDRHEHSLAALKRLGDNPDALADHGAKGRWLIVEFAVDNVQKLRLHELRRQRSSQPPRAERNRAEEEEPRRRPTARAATARPTAAAAATRSGGGRSASARPRSAAPTTRAAAAAAGRRRARAAEAAAPSERPRAPAAPKPREREREARKPKKKKPTGAKGREAREEAHHERLVQQYREKITRTVLDPLRGK